MVALSFILDHGADVETELRVPILGMNSSMPLLMVASLKTRSPLHVSSSRRVRISGRLKLQRSLFGTDVGLVLWIVMLG